MTTGYGVVTHPSPKCVVSCNIVVGLNWGSLKGVVRTEKDVDGTIDKACRWIELWDGLRVGDKMEAGKVEELWGGFDREELD